MVACSVLNKDDKIKVMKIEREDFVFVRLFLSIMRHRLKTIGQLIYECATFQTTALIMPLVSKTKTLVDGV